MAYRPLVRPKCAVCCVPLLMLHHRSFRRGANNFPHILCSSLRYTHADLHRQLNCHGQVVETGAYPFHTVSVSRSVRWTQYTGRARDHTRTIINNIKYTVHKTNNNKPHVFWGGWTALREHGWRARTKSAKASSADFNPRREKDSEEAAKLTSLFLRAANNRLDRMVVVFRSLWFDVQDLEKRRRNGKRLN